MKNLYVSDFLDLSIYLDAREEHIRRWYIERFQILRETALRRPESYFRKYASLSPRRRLRWSLRRSGMPSTGPTSGRT